MGELIDARLQFLQGALKVAVQALTVASDWNLDEVEIDGEMEDVADLVIQMEEALGVVTEMINEQLRKREL